MSVPNPADSGHGLEETVTGGTPVSHKRRAATHFTIISNGVGRDSRLTPAAAFLFLNLCGHAEGYHITTARIRYQTGMSRDVVQGALRLLKTLGYLVHERVRDETTGRFAYTYFTDDQPPGSPPNPTSRPVPENPSPDTTSDDEQNPRSAPVTPSPVPVDPHPKKTREEDQGQSKSENQTPAPPSSARSGAPVPKGPRLGDARAAEGDAAAGGQPRSQTEDPEQRAALRRARRALSGLLPAALIALMPERWPRALSATLAGELANRTPDQIAARIQRRWDSRGYVGQAYAGTLERPIGVAYALIRSTPCADPSCEDGTEIDSGMPCRCCMARYGERVHRAVRAGIDAAADGPDWLAPAEDDPEAIRRALFAFLGEDAA